MNWIKKLKQNKGAILTSVILAVVFIIVIKKLFFTPTPVTIALVMRQDIKAEVQGTGPVTVDVLAKTGSKINGRIQEVMVNENDIVKKGQTIALLENTDFRREVELKRSLLYADTVKAWQAMRAWNREKELVATGAVSQEEADEYEERYRVAESQVAASRADLRYQEYKLSETTILSPVNGKVIKRWVEAGDGVVTGQTLFTIADTSVIMVDANIDQAYASKIRNGQSATVILLGQSGKPLQGRVYRLNPQADPVTEEMVVEVAFREPIEDLQIGQWAEVYIQTGITKGALAIPKSAIVSVGNARFVFVIEAGDRIRKVKVTPEATSPRLPLISVAGDLQPGERIILNPRGLHGGAIVSVSKVIK